MRARTSSASDRFPFWFGWLVAAAAFVPAFGATRNTVLAPAFGVPFVATYGRFHLRATGRIPEAPRP